MKYYWCIVIDGFTDDKKSVAALRENLYGELWHPDTKVYYPVFREVPK
jgi:hypothetical protein